MTRQSMRCHIIRGVLTGIVGALALGLALMFVMAPKASAQSPARPACADRVLFRPLTIH